MRSMGWRSEEASPGRVLGAAGGSGRVSALRLPRGERATCLAGSVHRVASASARVRGLLAGQADRDGLGFSREMKEPLLEAVASVASVPSIR